MGTGNQLVDSILFEKRSLMKAEMGDLLFSDDR